MNSESTPFDRPAWRVFPGLADYASTLAAMEDHVDRMSRGAADEEIWLVEHPPVLTAGTSADRSDLLQPDRFPLFSTGRGGQFTYHGPGQRVIYPLLDLGRRGRDIRRYVTGLEAWAVAALGDLGVAAGISNAGTGIWVAGAAGGRGLAKIGAIGVRVRRWISFHGMAINVTTDLSHFDAIVPCGLSAHGITRLADLAPVQDLEPLDRALFNRLSVLMHCLSGTSQPRIKMLEAPEDCS